MDYLTICPMLHAALTKEFPDSNEIYYLIKRHPKYLYMYDKNGYMPIHLSILRNHFRYVNMFYDANPNILLEKTKDNYNCLHLAMTSGIVSEIAGFIVGKFPDSDMILELSVRGNEQIE